MFSTRFVFITRIKEVFMVLNIAALLMLIFVSGVVMYAIYFLGGLPGRVANERHQPQADAIRIMGWLGLLTGGIVWGAALIWAYYTPKTAPTGDLCGEQISSRVRYSPTT